MTQVVVIRVGRPAHIWYTKWSSPEIPHFVNNQTVRDLFVEQHRVIVVFVVTGDIPVFIASVDNVRPRDPLLDSDYPLGNQQGIYHTFLTFRNKYAITNAGMSLLAPIMDYIRYIPGQQIHINNNTSLNAIALFAIHNVRLDNIRNTTYINPNAL